MTPISSKPLDRITAEDIERLIAEAPPEGGSLEFKELLPAKKGEVDPWMAGEGRIAERARNEILAEVVAFANAYGGNLLLGIGEAAERPARAASPRGFIPRCAELAARLRLQARDCIEPQVPLLHVAGVVIEEDGAGVVVVRVPPSRMAPHRLTEPRRVCRRLQLLRGWSDEQADEVLT